MHRGDIKELLEIRRAIGFHARQSIRARYARSKFGEFWATLITAIYITVVGFVWAFVWGEDVGDYFVYIAIGHVLYIFFTSLVNESLGSIVADAVLYTNSYLNPIFSILSIYLRSSITLLHHLPILIGVVLIFNVSNLMSILLFPLNLLICFISMFYWSVILAFLVVRFRDLLQLFGLVMQISFLVTPVIWKIDRIPPNFIFIALANPFSAMLNITRDSLLGFQIYGFSYFVLFCWFVSGYICYLVFGKKLRKGLTLWL